MKTRFLSKVLTLAVISAVAPTVAAEDLPDPAKVVDTFEQLGGVHKGMRRNHVKGVCALGSFVGTKEASNLSDSVLFSGQSVPVIGRFSLDGPDLGASDASKSPRSMALRFQLPNGELHQTAMLNTPVFLAANVQSLFDFLKAHLADPATGKPDPEKLKAYAASHPDSKPMADWLGSHNPPPSFTNATYYSINVFKFVKGKNGTWVKWRFEPEDGLKAMTDTEIATAPSDFLVKRLVDRTRKGPVKWDMIVTIGAKGDPIVNPTLTWPAGRKEIKAGVLTLTQGGEDAKGQCEDINFDPNVLSAGVEPGPDEILKYRSAAYAVSFARRESEKAK